MVTQSLCLEDQPLRFNFPAEIRFRCSKCGLCCGDTHQKTRRVLLLKSDAERIATSAKRQIDTFATQTTTKQPYVYEIRKNAQNGKCIFLQQNRCMIYQDRPLICKFYPFELATDIKGIYTFKTTEECPGVSCPGRNGVGKKLDRRYFKELLELALAELNAEPR